MSEISKLDESIFELIRNNVSNFQSVSVEKLGMSEPKILDIAPQDHKFLSEILPPGSLYETLDIDPLSGATWIADITAKTQMTESYYDAVFCTEVMEHVSNPFLAASEILRILKPGGFAFFSSPFAFRIHGPLPDNWRITEHGWKELLGDFVDVRIQALEDPERFLMPLHYTIQAQKRNISD